MTQQTPWPACVGTHTIGHVQCDGDSSGKSKSDREPCSWRDRCGGFQVHLNSVDNHADEYMGDREFGDQEAAEFERQCVEWAVEYGVVSGVARGKGRGYFPFGYRGTCSRSFRERRERVDVAIEHFIEAIMAQFEDRRPLSRSVVIPGQFMVVDRRKQSRYVSIYCVSAGGRNVPVASARPKIRSDGVEIRVPADSEAWMMRPASAGFAAVSVDDGLFLSSLGVLDRDAIGRLARALKAMERVGEIRLPELRRYEDG